MSCDWRKFPNDGETAALVDTQLQLVFNEVVILTSGTAREVAVYQRYGDVLLESVPLSSSNVSGLGSNTLQITLSQVWASSGLVLGWFWASSGLVMGWFWAGSGLGLSL